MDSLQLGEQPTTNEINKYGLEWRIKYLIALDSLLKAYRSKNSQFADINKKDLITERKWVIEELELEHKIYHEKIIQRDWKLRAERDEEKSSVELKEATENIERIIELCRQKESSNEHIKQLIKRYNTINKHDSDQLIIIYKSMKVALEKTGIKL